MASINTRDLPHSNSYKIFYCGHCENAHIVLYNEADEAFAVFLISPEQVLRLLASITNYNNSERNPDAS